MSQLTRDEILHVARLANLKVTKKEIEKFTRELSKVVSHVSELDGVDTKGVEPTSQTTGLANVYREDKIDPSRILNQEEALSGTDKTKNGYFKTRPILSKNK